MRRTALACLAAYVAASVLTVAGCLRPHEIRPEIEAREVGQNYVFESEEARNLHPNRYFYATDTRLFGPFPRFWIEPRIRLDRRDWGDLGAAVQDAPEHPLVLRTRFMVDSGFYHDFANYRIDLQDSEEIGAGASQPDQDILDVQQAFCLLGTKRSTWTFKLGRQEVDFGSGRLLGTDWHDNLDRSFDGARLTLADGWRVFDLEPRQWTRRLDVLAADPVRHIDGRLNVEHDGPRLAAILYSDRRLFPLRVDAAAIFTSSTGDVAGELAGAGREVLTTLSASVSGERLGVSERITFDAEAAVQFGRRGLDDHLAGMFGARLAHTFPTPWKVTVRAGIEAASGDGDPADGHSGTFRPPFPGDLRDRLGLLRLATLSNVVATSLGASFGPAEDLRLGADVRWLRLSDRSAGWFDADGSPVVLTPGGLELGCELDVFARYRFATDRGNDAWFEAGLAAFDPADGLRPVRDPVRAFYLQATTRF